MGGGVAEVAAASGSDVVVRARSHESGEHLLSCLDASLARQVAKGTREDDDAAHLRQRISVTTELSDLHSCDFIIETVVEDLAIKKALFRALDDVAGPDTILATCTSTLAVIDLAMQTSRPDKVCGVHFFNPVNVMTLVEVVQPLCTSDETITAVTAFVHACGKEPIAVADRAGFIVNALLFPYLNNAVRLLESGVATKEGIDSAMKGGCGFPMGPFALLDLVGLDTSLAILEALHAEYADPNFAPVPLLRRMVSAGHLGRKSGHGFYLYGH